MSFRNIKKRAHHFLMGSDGVAAIEMALVTPVLLVMLLGMIDAGRALVLNKKVTAASQVVADLLTRTPTVTTAEINDAIIAGRMAIEPYPVDSYGVDIVAIRYAGPAADPTEAWRETVNMTPRNDVLTLASGLGLEGEGVLVVSVGYEYTPVFTGFVFDAISMRETAVLRGRRSAFVGRM